MWRASFPPGPIAILTWKSTLGRQTDTAEGSVVVRETRRGQFQQEIITGAHRLLADEPVKAGGLDSGPGPYDLLLAALGACTSMTVRLYADRKQIPLKRTQVRLRHEKIYASDCAECETKEGKIDHIDRVITLRGRADRRTARAASGDRRQMSGASDAEIRGRHPHRRGALDFSGACFFGKPVSTFPDHVRANWRLFARARGLRR